MGFEIKYNPYKQSVSTVDFFEHLSKKNGLLWGHGFDKQFEITHNRIALKDGSLYTISEVSMPWKISPKRFFMQPQSTKLKKDTTNWLRDLVIREKDNIVRNPKNDVRRIVIALDRIIGKMTRNMNKTDAQFILKDSESIKNTLESAYTEFHKKYFEEGQGLKAYRATSPATFFNALSRRWTPGIGKFGFNQLFQVVQRKNGEFEVHLSSKPWFFQKMIRIPSEFNSLRFWEEITPPPVPSAKKVATAQKLEAMIKQEFKFIRYLKPNIDGMIANLKEIKKNIIRHTMSSDKEKIEKAMDGAIRELTKLVYLTRKDFNNSWKGFVWKYTVAPLKNRIIAVIL